MNIKLHKIVIIAPILMGLFLAYVLLLPPLIGKPDNGDFARTINIAGLHAWPCDGKFHSQWKIASSPTEVLTNIWGPDWTSGVLLIKPAILMNMTVLDTKIFDIRFLSLTYIILFSISAYILIRYSYTFNNYIVNLSTALLLLFIFTDAGYISYFNSFFGEANSLVFLFLTIGFALLINNNNKYNTLFLLFFAISSTIFVTAKNQNIPLYLFILFIYIRLFYILNNNKHRFIILLFAIFSFIFCTACYSSIGKVTLICNKYQTVFSGVLKDSPTPEKDLEELGIPTRFAMLAGSYFFTPNLPIDPMDTSLDSELYSKITFQKVLLFYILHPERLWSKFKVIAKHSFDYFEITESNIESKIEHEKILFYNTIRTWIGFNLGFLFKNLFFIIGFPIIYVLALSIIWIKNKDTFHRLHIEIFFIVAAMGFSQTVVSILGSGEADLSKHLFLFNLLYDIMISSALIYIINFIHTFKTTQVFTTNTKNADLLERRAI